MFQASKMTRRSPISGAIQRFRHRFTVLFLPPRFIILFYAYFLQSYLSIDTKKNVIYRMLRNLFMMQRKEWRQYFKFFWILFPRMTLGDMISLISQFWIWFSWFAWGVREWLNIIYFKFNYWSWRGIFDSDIVIKIWVLAFSAWRNNLKNAQTGFCYSKYMYDQRWLS